MYVNTNISATKVAQTYSTSALAGTFCSVKAEVEAGGKVILSQCISCQY